ncbi:MAG: DUF350 domain-containing protein [Pirellulaceae bacterium]|nr:DUF350 domain-containing protein [Planctomycetales bacterium]
MDGTQADFNVEVFLVKDVGKVITRWWRGAVLAGGLLVGSAGTLAAQDAVQAATGEGAMSFDWGFLMSHVMMAVIFGLIGMVLFGLCILLVVKICPFSVRKEIEEDQNTSLGIIVGAMIIGIAMIISAAIIG